MDIDMKKSIVSGLIGAIIGAIVTLIGVVTQPHIIQRLFPSSVSITRLEILNNEEDPIGHSPEYFSNRQYDLMIAFRKKCLDKVECNFRVSRPSGDNNTIEGVSLGDMMDLPSEYLRVTYYCGGEKKEETAAFGNTFSATCR